MWDALVRFVKMARTYYFLYFYFCTGIYISVLGYILLYCCIHEFYCTEEYSRTADEYVCSGTYVFVLRD